MNKKIILSISIIIIIFNALLPHYVFADEPVKLDSLEGQNARKEIKSQTLEDVEHGNRTANMDEKNGGLAGVGNEKGSEGGSEPANFISTVVKAVFKVFAVIPYTAQGLMTIVTTGDNEKILNGSTLNEKFDVSKINWFTIKKAVLGKVPIFDVNFFEVKTEDSKVSSDLKQAVLGWYNVMYRLAQAISLLTLIYIGIRMAISSTAREDVKYKVMLKNWLVAFGILFILHYIIVVILKLNDLLVSLVPNSLLEKGYEEQIIKKSIDVMDPKQSVWTVLIYFITYVIMVGYEIYFFIKYFKRVLTVGFLIIIAPLITITYPIDKLGDNQAQAYSKWMKLFISNVLMQAVQALMYGIFVFSAAAIADKAPMIAIVFFIGILKGEEVFKKLFNLTW